MELSEHTNKELKLARENTLGTYLWRCSRYMPTADVTRLQPVISISINNDNNLLVNNDYYDIYRVHS